MSRHVLWHMIEAFLDFGKPGCHWLVFRQPGMTDYPVNSRIHIAVALDVCSDFGTGSEYNHAHEAV